MKTRWSFLLGVFSALAVLTMSGFTLLSVGSARHIKIQSSGDSIPYPVFAYTTNSGALGKVVGSTLTPGPVTRMFAEHITGAAAAETTDFRPRINLQPGTITVDGDNIIPAVFGTFDCDWETVGTGGSTGVVVKVRDLTAGADICSCTLAACTDSAATNKTCDCNTRITNNTSTKYAIQLSASTDCAVNPINIRCELSITP